MITLTHRWTRIILSAAAALAAAACAAEPEVDLPEPDLAVASLAEDRSISLDEAQARIGWQSAAADLEADLAGRLGDRFGGIWIDPSDGDRVKVGLVGGAGEEGLWQAVDTRGLAEAVDAVPVAHSLAALEATAEDLGADLARVNAGAAAPLMVSLRPDRNAVMLSAPEGAALSASQRDYLDEVTRAHGDAVEVDAYQGRYQTMDCSYPHCTPPLRGGVAIYNDVGSAIGKCTAGFIGRSQSDRKLYLFTAGHCARHVDDDVWWTKWNGANHAIGPVHNWTYGSRGDMAILEILHPRIMKPGACVMVTKSADTTSDHKYGISGTGKNVVGSRVCTTGAALGHSDCGTVQATGVTVTYTDGTTVSGLAKSSMCVVPGDSGAPVYASHKALGLVSGGATDGCTTLYQGIRGAEDQMRVDVALGDCP